MFCSLIHYLRLKMALLKFDKEELPSFHIHKYTYECETIIKNNCFSHEWISSLVLLVANWTWNIVKFKNIMTRILEN